MGFFSWGFLTLILGSLFYFICTLYRDAKYFKDRGVINIGNGVLRVATILLKGTHVAEELIPVYDNVKAKGQRFAGSVDFGSIAYFIVDLDLIKQILIKDFDHFVDRRKFGNGKVFSKTLLFQEGERWKALRSKMSPAFSTGKIRRMFAILDQSCKKMVKYLETEMSKSGGVVDLQEGYSKYTMDVIASVAFGVDSKAFEQSGSSLFEQMGDKLQFKFDSYGMVKFVISIVSPRLADFLGMSIVEPEAIEFFSGVIKSAIKHRLETKEKRDDFLQIMLEARAGRAGKLKVDDGDGLTEFEQEAAIVTKGQEEASSKMSFDLDDDDLVAQSVLFILGGFDSTQGLLGFAAYSLAVYPEIQERLFQEVKKSVEDNDGELTYDSVNQMEYMEMYISETLRHYPPAIALERQCTKAFKIPDSNIIVEKGMIVTIPTFAIQRDPDHYPEPDKFDPERFSPENRTKIHPCAYMPFGVGPRNCIAMRFALVEGKMAVAHLVLNFTFEPSEKTPIPMKFVKSGALKPEGGLWLKLQSRK